MPGWAVGSVTPPRQLRSPSFATGSAGAASSRHRRRADSSLRFIDVFGGRCGARPGSTRSTARAPRSATPAATVRSSSRCASSWRRSRETRQRLPGTLGQGESGPRTAALSSRTRPPSRKARTDLLRNRCWVRESAESRRAAANAASTDLDFSTERQRNGRVPGDELKRPACAAD